MKNVSFLPRVAGWPDGGRMDLGDFASCVLTGFLRHRPCFRILECKVRHSTLVFFDLCRPCYKGFYDKKPLF